MKSFLFVITISLLGFSAAPGNAQTITPSHVYQAADSMVLELQLLAAANFTNTSVPAVGVIAGKRPRHVIQKGQEILRQIETLMRINGQQMANVAPVPVEEIKPANVMRPVSRALKEIRSLKPVFRIESTGKDAPLIQGKKPGDVYARLTQASILIGRLDMPKPVPNDVQRSALAIMADMEILAKSLGVAKPDALGETFTGKSPGHVYTHARDVLLALKQLVESNAALAIPGGIVLPPEKKGKITPGDVLDMQNTILAEISSIKVKAGANSPTPNIPSPSGKTPSDVYGATNDALLYVQAFLAQATVQ